MQLKLTKGQKRYKEIYVIKETLDTWQLFNCEALENDNFYTCI